MRVFALCAHLAKLFQAVDHDNVNRSTVEIALNKIQRGHEKKALKLLCSNGVADVDEQTVDELRNMHPELKEPLILPKPSTSQLSIDLPTIRKKLYDDAAKRDISKDVYGWTPSLFYQERAKSDGFLDSLARFGAFLVDNTQAFPPICATLLSAGYLTPLQTHTAGERGTQHRWAPSQATAHQLRIHAHQGCAGSCAQNPRS
jgi:hypothetical protein